MTQLRAFALVLLFLGFHIINGAHAAECDDYYFGLGTKTDFKRAYECYAEEGNVEMQIVMLLNGEGVAKDLKKARALHKSASGDAPDSPALKQLDENLREREGLSPGNWARIDYCEEIAWNTLEVNRCASIRETMAAQEGKAKLAKLKVGLTPDQRHALEKLEVSFEEFQKADGSRMYAEHIEGSIRNIAAFGQKDFLRGNYLARVDQILVNRSLNSPKPLAIVDKELNAQYAKKARSLAGYENRADLKRSLREAQQKWIVYRDAWAHAGALCLKGNAKKISEQIAAAITVDRISELKHNPVGPGSDR